MILEGQVFTVSRGFIRKRTSRLAVTLHSLVAIYIEVVEIWRIEWLTGNFQYTLTLLFISKAHDMNTHGMSSIIVIRSLGNKWWNIGKKHLQVYYWNTNDMDEGTKSTKRAIAKLLRYTQTQQEVGDDLGI